MGSASSRVHPLSICDGDGACIFCGQEGHVLYICDSCGNSYNKVTEKLRKVTEQRDALLDRNKELSARYIKRFGQKSYDELMNFIDIVDFFDSRRLKQ